MGTSTCSHCKEDKPLGLFSPNPLKKNGVGSWCKACQVVLAMERGRDSKSWWIAYKGGKCMVCRAEGLHPACYSFHHRNPHEKEFTMNHMRSYSFEAVQKELDKTDLVCLNCHAIIHAKY